MSSTSSTTSTSGLINMNGFNLTNGQGINVATIVNELVSAASVPETQWEAQETTVSSQISDLNTIESNVKQLLSDVTSLSDPAGEVASRTATSSDTSLVSASAVSATAVGDHTVVVSNLATTSSYYTGEVTSASTQLASGTFDITVGSGKTNTITIGSSNNTLTGLASSINKMNIGVTASVVTDANGARLALVSQSSGAAGDLTVADTTTGGSGLSFTKAVTGVNASLTVDGVPVSSASNTVTGAVAGMTLNLAGADPKTTVNISITPDTTDVVKTIASFVSDYNTVVSNVNTEYTYNSSTGTAGPLSGNSTLEMLQSTMLGQSSYTAGSTSGINTLADLGITMNDDGTLTVDSTTLNSAVSNNYTAVQNFLQGDGTLTTGFATQLKSQLSSLTDPVDGAFTVDIKGLNSTVSSLKSEVSDFQTYITTQQAAWTSQYDALNVILQEYPMQQEALQAEMGNSDYANTSTS